MADHFEFKFALSQTRRHRRQSRFAETLHRNDAGRIGKYFSISDSQFDETAFESQFARNRMPVLIFSHSILRLKFRFLSGGCIHCWKLADKPAGSLRTACGELMFQPDAAAERGGLKWTCLLGMVSTISIPFRSPIYRQHRADTAGDRRGSGFAAGIGSFASLRHLFAAEA